MQFENNDTDGRELLSGCYWIRKWEAACGGASQTISQGYAEPGFWDALSAGYDEGFDANEQKSLAETIVLFKRNGILHSGTRVLDIGCGTGRLAFALAHEGAEVTAMDFSEGMLQQLQQKTPLDLKKAVHPVKADWGNLDLYSKGWAGQFDFVIANMTPALQNPEALLQMNTASRGWCFLKGWAQRRDNPLLEALWPLVMEQPMNDRPPDFLFQLNYLFAQGFFPAVSFEEIRWDKETPLEEAANYYSSYFAGISSRPEEWMRHAIIEHLNKIATYGIVKEHSKGWTGSLLWRI